MYDRLAVFVLCFLIVPGLAKPLQGQSYERTVRDTVDVAPEAVSIENDEGSITVSTWDRDEVVYEARIVSEQAAEIVDQAVIDVDHFHQQVSLVSNFDHVKPRWSFGPKMYGYGVTHPEVHYTLTVPAAADISVEDQESTIEIVGVAGALQVDTDEGSLQVTDQRGPVQVNTREGTASLNDVRGDLKIDTHEGSVMVEGLRGRLFLDTHEGEAEIGIDSLAAAEVDTHEGDVTLTVPKDAGFDLSTDLDEDAALRGALPLDSLRNEEGDIHGSVRGGGPLVHLTSHEGTISIRSR